MERTRRNGQFTLGCQLLLSMGRRNHAELHGGAFLSPETIFPLGSFYGK